MKIQPYIKAKSCGCASGAADGCCGEQAVKTVSASLTLKDRLGAWKARWGIGRMDYKVEPGLYAIGKPDNFRYPRFRARDHVKKRGFHHRFQQVVKDS